MVCLHEVEKNEADDNGNDRTDYQYDYNEFILPDGVSVSDIESNPEAYLDYEPEPTPTIEDLTEAINALTQIITGGE